jgi:hypothetical protein
MENKFKMIDTAIFGSGSILAIQLTSSLPIETMYMLFVQSLVATATIGKILWDMAKSDKNREK